MKAKLLGFDSWTKGAHHFQRLSAALLEHEITLALVHLGSWGNDPGRPIQEKIGTLDVRDISFYGNDSFERILDIEQPDAVILLSTHTFAHRAFIRYCRLRSIPTLHLYHGLVKVQVTGDRKGSYNINRLAYLRFVLSKLGKLIKHTLPCYIKSLLNTRAKPTDWYRFLLDIGRMAIGIPSLSAADDAKTTRCAVYTNADVEHAVRTYAFEEKDVSVVGNPDLAHFGLQQHMLGSLAKRPKLESRTIMYIDTGLLAVGLVFAGRDAVIDHIISTRRALAAQGIAMRFKPKPHPAHIREFLEHNLYGTGVDLVSNEDFFAKLQECSACIVETTSLALVPALMGMPLLYANYGPLRKLRFGPVLTSYPRGYVLKNISEVSEILRRDDEQFDCNAVNDWIAFNTGPLPTEKMPHRVAELVVSMIRDAKLG